MRASTWEELGEHPAEHYVVDEPFTGGDLVRFDATGEVGVVEGCERHDGSRSRVDEPGDCPWWEVTVRFGDGQRVALDADELADVDEDDLTAGQQKDGSDVDA